MGKVGTQPDGMKVEITYFELDDDGSHQEHHCLRIIDHLGRKAAVEP